MILKLIEAGGFSGLKKTAEKDISDLPQDLQSHVETLFSAPPPPAQARAQSASRDRATYSIEYNGKTLPVQSIQPSEELHDLIEKMKNGLQYQSDKK